MGLLVIVVAVGAGLFAAGDRDQALVHQANAEHWYRIEQHGQHIGLCTTPLLRKH